MNSSLIASFGSNFISKPSSSSHYQADNISEARRPSAFGVLSGTASLGFVSATLAARLLSTTHIFQVAVIVSVTAAVYMRIFLKESRCIDDLNQPMLKDRLENTRRSQEASKTVHVFSTIPSPRDIFRLLKSSKGLSLAAFVSFFIAIAQEPFQSASMYYLNYRFQFRKDQLAVIFLISGISGSISQLLIVPTLAPIFGEKILLSTGLLIGCVVKVLNSIAWTEWVVYFVSTLQLFSGFVDPSLRSITSKQVGPDEQGLVQGSISGISSIANFIAPFIFSPLTALFLSERAPFYFPGFSILCIGIALLIAFIPSTMIPTNQRNAADDNEAQPR